MVFGESMFSSTTDASKIALCGTGGVLPWLNCDDRLPAKIPTDHPGFWQLRQRDSFFDMYIKPPAQPPRWTFSAT
jgi:hypothetical protein